MPSLFAVVHSQIVKSACTTNFDSSCPRSKVPASCKNLSKSERMSPFPFIQHRFLRSSGVATTTTTSDDALESSSIFSEPEWKLYTKKKKNQSKTYATARDRWEHLRQNFIKRDILLARLTSSKSTAFRRQLIQRERIVRQRAVEHLLVTKCSNEKQRNELEKEILESYKFENLLTENETTTSTSPILSWVTFDAWTFEMNSSVPAVLALLIHTSAHSGIDGSIGVLAEKMAQWMHFSWWTKQTVTLLVGLVLLRSTGDVFWWARDPIYDTVKFDYHNRHSLRYRDARWMSKIRTKTALRVTMFMIGFYLTYGAATSFFLLWHRYLLDERSSILEKLPSVNYRNHLGVCPAASNESFCSNSCQYEIQRQGTEWSLNKMDLQWTWSIVTLDSYEYYWTEWMLGGGDSTMHNIVSHLVFYLGFLVVGIKLLRMLGLKMEDKY